MHMHSHTHTHTITHVYIYTHCSQLRVEIWDWDHIGTDDFLGQITVRDRRGLGKDDIVVYNRNSYDIIIMISL